MNTNNILNVGTISATTYSASTVSTDNLTSSNASINLLKNLDGANTRSITNMSGVSTSTLTTNTLTSTGTQISVNKRLDMDVNYIDWSSNIAFVGVVNGQRTCLYCTFPGDFRYYGEYIDVSTYGFMTDQATSDYLFSSASTATTKNDSIRILGRGGLQIFEKNVLATPTPSSGCTLFVNGGILYSKNTSGVDTPLTYPKEIGEISVAATLGTSIAVIGSIYAIQATTWSQNPDSFNWSLPIAGGANFIRYDGPFTRKVKLTASISVQSSTTNHNLTFRIYKNAGLTGQRVTSGTLLTAFATQRIANAQDIQCVVLNCISTVTTNDSFTCAVSSTAINIMTAISFNFVAETL
jgi:hypothetical protein